VIDSRLARILGWFRADWHDFQLWVLPCAWTFVLLLLSPLKDTRSGCAETAYNHAVQMFQQGDSARSQSEAELGIWQFQTSNPDWAARFDLLQAEIMVRRGKYDDALRLLADYHTDPHHSEDTIRKLAIEADALTHQQQLATADQRLSQAEGLCRSAVQLSCGYLLRTRGLLSVGQGKAFAARQYFLDSLLFARAHQDQWAEVGALNNLGFAAMQIGRFDEAVDWLRSANRSAVKLGSSYWTQLVVGNLGWSHYQLGDDEGALEQFLEAEKSAAALGNLRYELKWISDAGYVYHDSGDLTRATQCYRQAFDLAARIGSKEDIAIALEDLAEVSVETGKLEEASRYLDQVTPMESTSGDLLRTHIMLTQGMLAAARHQDQQAEKLFRAVQNDPASPTTKQLDAGWELARLFESQGDAKSAEQMYRATLNAFESARAQLKNENSRLPFVANVTGIYDDYIHFLVRESRSDEALAAADQSRARTLAQGLGVAMGDGSFRPASLNPRQIAQKTGATLLFYWLGTLQSYLWVITPARITLIALPARAEIVAHVERYRKALLDLQDPLEAGNEDGRALYQLLVAPAAGLIRPNAPVMILADGALSQLNFEALLAPGPSPKPDLGSEPSPGAHYWIDDATLLSAPSLAMLAAAKPMRDGVRNLLLLGNPVSPSPDYPSLPLFGFEMSQIERHFAPERVAVFAGQQASPAAYLSSEPAQYSYIHFVSHGVASRTDPLDSAIILSGSKAGDDSFKLYARDIMQHPIDAKLVTITTCYGSGTRSYAGEGLVGLSWAFLRAGAHSVVGALWEVSDDSTPRLMDALYQGLEEGQSPAAALRRAKLALLHEQSRFHTPFYWAPFQIYTRQ
jgi:CHAT domain-containing protein/Flp pilus assembly protein TadD